MATNIYNYRWIFIIRKISFVLLFGQDVAEDVEAPLSPLGVFFFFLAAIWEGEGRGKERRGERGEEKRRRTGGEEGKGECLGNLEGI